jgi:class 3 adenylate cyclase
MGIGLGEAGSGLIKNYLGSDAEVDIVMPGEMIMAVYGFCDIRNFTDVTEILEEGVMLFVNKIADIVHYITDRTLGTANKNVGDAFLLVWKAPSKVTKLKKIAHMGEDESVKSNVSDLALYSFLKIFAEINRAAPLKTYTENVDIQSRLGPNYKVRLGIGIHYGWAVEGAIGSYHKVDASYLSPNVNMCMRLEELTKEYGTPILISGEFYDCLSNHVKGVCRKLDTINIKGKEDPLRVYTPNISDKGIFYPDFSPIKIYNLKLKETFAFKKLVKREMARGNLVGPSLYQNDVDISLLTCFNNQEFLGYFNTAIQAYERGDREMSKDYFEKAKVIVPKDGPTLSIYEFMKSNVFEKPDGWNGVRTL